MAKPPPNTPTLTAYHPTLRDQVATWLMGNAKSGSTRAELVRGLIGSEGVGGGGPGFFGSSLIDLTPLGLPFAADEAGRQMSSGHPVTGAASLAMALPVPIAGTAVKAAKGAVGAAAKAMGKSAVLDAAKEAIAARMASKAAPPIVAYHGSPYMFDQFDAGKIGTGEGAQAYGHGLYFAQNENTAKSYRNGLGRTVYLDGKPLYQNGQITGTTGDAIVDAMLIDNGGDVNAALNDARYHLAPVGGGAKRLPPYTASQLEQLRGRVTSDNGGSMYQVGINAHPDHFLDWDKPLSEQHPTVQSGVHSAWDSAVQQVQTKRAAAGIADSAAYRGPTKPNDAGEAYHALTNIFGGDQAAATKALQDAGIPGIKYLDQGSRGVGDGTRNFVVFDPAHVDIMKRYGIPATLFGGVGAAAAAGSQGGGDQTGALQF